MPLLMPAAPLPRRDAKCAMFMPRFKYIIEAVPRVMPRRACRTSAPRYRYIECARLPARRSPPPDFPPRRLAFIFASRLRRSLMPPPRDFLPAYLFHSHATILPSFLHACLIANGTFALHKIRATIFVIAYRRHERGVAAAVMPPAITLRLRAG